MKLMCRLFGHKQIVLKGFVRLCSRCEPDLLREYELVLRRPFQSSGMVECQGNCGCPRGGSYRRVQP